MPQKIEFAYASFLIRLWRQTSPLPQDLPGEWQSEVEHIQSGQHWKFSSMIELLDFLQQQADQLEKEKSVSVFE